MKLPDSTVSVASHGTTRIAESHIEMSAKMFEILSSQLYSNKVEAVVREISTNAADAHLAAGKPDAPFKALLPTKHDPFFAVRDYGPGLSPEDVATVYPHYGRSTKEADEHATGCLGLGSKSPLAYADVFNVTSYQKGVCRSYAIYRGPDKKPVTDLLSEAETSEPDGVEVRVAVRAGDFDSFHQAAQRVYQYFRVPPVLGNARSAVAKPVYALRTPTCGLVAPTHSAYGEAAAYVVMGDVRYPVDKAQVQSAVYLPDPANPGGPPIPVKYGIPDPFRSWQADLYLPMGAVEVTPSREALSYTPATVAAVRAAFTRAHDEAAAELSRQIGDAPDLWSARFAARDLAKFQAFGTSLQWKGREASAVLRFNSDHAPPPGPDGDRGPEVVGRVRSQRYSWDTSRTVWGNRPLPDRLEVTDKLRAVFADDLKGPGRYALCRRFVEDEHEGEGFVLVFHPAQLTPEYLARVGWGHLVRNLSSLQTPRPKRTGPVARREKTLLRLVRVGDFAPEQEYDPKSGGVFVETWRDQYYAARRRHPVSGGRPKERYLVCPSLTSTDRGDLRTLLGDKCPEVYGVRTQDRPRLERLGSWDEFEDFVARTLARLAPELDPKAALAAAYRDDKRELRPYTAAAVKLAFGAGSAFGEFVRLYGEARAAAGDPRVAAYVRLSERYLDAGSKPDPRYKAAFDRAALLYPLAFTAAGYAPNPGHAAPTAADVKRYVELVDAAEAPPAAARAPRRRRLAVAAAG